MLSCSFLFASLSGICMLYGTLINDVETMQTILYIVYAKINQQIGSTA